MLEFQNPAGFLLLLLIPLLYILRHLKIFNQISFTAVLANWNGKAFEYKGKAHRFFSAFANLLIIIAFIFCAAAFSSPVILTREKVYSSLGTDIFFVVDTSPSMAAKDVDGLTRLEAAKNSIKNLTIEHDGCRFGIVALGSSASVLVPPTADRSVFNTRMDELKVGILGNGSAIGDGLSTAVCHLVSSSAPKKCIILLTDGENNAGEIHPETSAKIASENSIALYVVGVGSKGNVPIEYTDPVTGKLYSGYLDSDFNSASLRKIAAIANGQYFEVRTINELVASLMAVAKNESVSQTYSYRNVNKFYYQKLLRVAIILFIAAWIIKRIFLREMICFRLKKILYVRSAFLVLAFILLLTAHSGIAWGTYFVPVQKSEAAVSFVFDISNSMLAEDGPGGMTRLESAGVYAKKLLKNMNGTNVSVVLAKGEGIAAIPLTEDTSIIESLIEVMNPNLMTAPGTSLGKGILCAKESFPQNYSAAGRIWVFTDGEETDRQLVNACVECIKSGIPLTIVGFGKETETEILAGDKKTKVQSALRTKQIEAAISEANGKMSFYKNKAGVSYINSTQRGSAMQLLNQLTLENGGITSYEAKTIPRYRFFLLASIFAFALSFFFTEADLKKFSRNIKKTLGASLVVLAVLNLSGCSGNTAKILDGTYSWHKKQYRHSVSQFKKAAEEALQTENQNELAYCYYNLGTAYSMLDENESALENFSAVSATAPDNVRFAAYYNAGIIEHKNANYEQAREFFRKALEIDNTKINAKINLELSLQMINVNAKQNESRLTPASDEKSDLNDLENAVFRHIKENDKNQWKNSESNQPQNLENDY